MLALLSCRATKTQEQLFEEQLAKGKSAFDKKDYKSAIAMLEPTLQLQATTDSKTKADIYFLIATSHCELKNIEACHHFYDEAVASYRAAGEDSLEAKTHVVIARSKRLNNNNNKALESYLKAASLYERRGEVTSCVEALREAAKIQREQYQFNEALNTYQKGLSITKGSRDFIGQAYLVLDASELYLDLQQARSAETLLAQSRALVRHYATGNQEAKILEMKLINRTAVVHLMLARYKEALAIFHNSGLKKSDNNSETIKTTGMIALSHFGLRMYPEAIAHFQKAIQLAASTGEIRLQAYNLIGLGRTHLHLRQFEKALNCFARAESLHGSKDRYLQTVALYNSGTALTALGRLPEAESKLLSAMHLVKSMAPIPFDELHRIYPIEDFYSLLAGVLLANGKSKLAYEVLETGRARLSQALTKWREIDSKNSEPLEISVAAADFSKISASVEEDVTILEYFHSGNLLWEGQEKQELWIFVINKGELFFHKEVLTSVDLTSRIANFLSLVTNISTDLRNVRKASRDLYDVLIRPVENHLEEKLVIVPWGPLYYLPFSSLWDGDESASSGKYLGQRCIHTISPSGTIYIATKRSRSIGRNRVLVLGNPKTKSGALSGSEWEAEQVAKQFPESVILTAEKATETALKSPSNDPDVIHLATHGYFDPAYPFASFIDLTPDSMNDGKLFLPEIFALKWPRLALVTLSSCSSGLGNLGSGDELIGMSQAFLYAGASSVLSALWNVDDQATRDFMNAFYVSYLSGKTKSEALREAQNFSRSRWFHPNYWAPFVLYGDWS